MTENTVPLRDWLEQLIETVKAEMASIRQEQQAEAARLRVDMEAVKNSHAALAAEQKIQRDQLSRMDERLKTWGKVAVIVLTLGQIIGPFVVWYLSKHNL